MAKPNHFRVSQSAYRAFIRAYGLFRGRMRPYFARFGISGAQWGILRQLHRAERQGKPGLRLADLGRRLLVQPPSVTGLVDRLERLGFVMRIPSHDDQRGKQAQLTPTGRRLVQRILKRHPTQIRAFLAGLDHREQSELGRLMEKLPAHLESLDPRQSHGVPP